MTPSKIQWTLTFLFIFSFFSCSKKQEKSSPLRPVRYKSVGSAQLDTQKSFTGLIKAHEESHLSFNAPGTLKKVHVEVGQNVKKDQLLAEMDAQKQKLKVQEAKISLTRIQAQLKNHKLTYERVKALYAEGASSKADLDGAKTAFDATRALYNSQQKAVELAQIQLKDTQIFAPKEGSIADIPATINENKSPGQSILVFVSKGNPEIELKIPEKYISSINKDQEATVHINSLESQKFNAVVSEVSTAALHGSSTYRVLLKFSGTIPPIKPGMSAEIFLKWPQQENSESIVLAPHVFKDENGKKYVFILKKEKDQTATVLKKAVEIGDFSDEGIEILSGINNGDFVVTAGVQQLKEGQKVKMLPSWNESL